MIKLNSDFNYAIHFAISIQSNSNECDEKCEEKNEIAAT